jgi:5-hydroxyisourate hydrolase-like protein (transthyretin family)
LKNWKIGKIKKLTYRLSFSIWDFFSIEIEAIFVTHFDEMVVIAFAAAMEAVHDFTHDLVVPPSYRLSAFGFYF